MRDRQRHREREWRKTGRRRRRRRRSRRSRDDEWYEEEFGRRRRRIIMRIARRKTHKNTPKKSNASKNEMISPDEKWDCSCIGRVQERRGTVSQNAW